MKKKFSKIVSAFLAGAMLLSTAPVGTFAAVASDLPDNMADSAILVPWNTPATMCRSRRMMERCISPAALAQARLHRCCLIYLTDLA